MVYLNTIPVTQQTIWRMMSLSASSFSLVGPMRWSE